MILKNVGLAREYYPSPIRHYLEKIRNFVIMRYSLKKQPMIFLLIYGLRPYTQALYFFGVILVLAGSVERYEGIYGESGR